MNLEFMKKYFRKKTRFGLKIGQCHKVDARKWVSWCLISRNKRSFEVLGHGDLSAADIQRISDEISEDEMFIYGSFQKRAEVMDLNAITMILPLDEHGMQGIVTKGKIYQVIGEEGEFEYIIDTKQSNDYSAGKLRKDQVKWVKMTNLTNENARKIFWEFINS